MHGDTSHSKLHIYALVIRLLSELQKYHHVTRNRKSSETQMHNTDPYTDAKLLTDS
jgi:hypothetical protein